jgi:choline-phosphate cytidylyltransferase
MTQPRFDQQASTMEPQDTNHHKRLLLSKRSFGKPPVHKVDSPAYDACVPSSLVRLPLSPLFSSEEDNDPFTDDGSSYITSSLRQGVATQHRGPGASNARSSSPASRSRLKHTMSPSMLSDDSVDSPTYDGDIESSTTVGRDREPSPVQSHSALTSTLPSPAPVIQNLPVPVAVIQSPSTASSSDAEIEPARVIVYNTPSTVAPEPAHAAQAFNPSTLSSEDIQAFVRREINVGLHRKYKINEPPVGRPVRVYADGTCLLVSRRLFYSTWFSSIKVYTTSFTMGRL